MHAQHPGLRRRESGRHSEHTAPGYIESHVDRKNMDRAKGEYVLPLSRESFKRAYDMDLNIASGSDAGVYPHGENAGELVARVDQGMSPGDAIRSATLWSAEALGTPDRGQIKVGLMADLIAVPGNPLENISLLQNVPFVMKEGVVYKQEP